MARHKKARRGGAFNPFDLDAWKNLRIASKDELKDGQPPKPVVSSKRGTFVGGPGSINPKYKLQPVNKPPVLGNGAWDSIVSGVKKIAGRGSRGALGRKKMLKL